MDWLELLLTRELPEGWELDVERSPQGITLQCQHIVLGGQEFHFDQEADDHDRRAAQILARLREIGLVEATEAMPSLTDAEVETLREAHAVIAAASLSKAQARSVVGLTQSLGQVSEAAVDWAMSTLDLLEDWHEFPPDPSPT